MTMSIKRFFEYIGIQKAKVSSHAKECDVLQLIFNFPVYYFRDFKAVLYLFTFRSMSGEAAPEFEDQVQSSRVARSDYKVF